MKLNLSYHIQYQTKSVKMKVKCKKSGSERMFLPFPKKSGGLKSAINGFFRGTHRADRVIAFRLAKVQASGRICVFSRKTFAFFLFCNHECVTLRRPIFINQIIP